MIIKLTTKQHIGAILQFITYLNKGSDLTARVLPEKNKDGDFEIVVESLD